MLIPLTKYAEAHGKTPGHANNVARRGGFTTAQKLGRDWVIDSDEPWPTDGRIKSGKYLDARKKNT